MITNFVVCGTGSYYLPTKQCYEVYEERLTWDEARKSCKEKGGDLAIVKDTNIQNFLMDLTQIPAWVGGYKINEQWVWTDLTWSFWYGFWYNEASHLSDAKGGL